MNVTLKPLTVVVTRDTSNDSASITIKDDRTNVVLGPLIHFHISERGIQVINDHIAQLVHNDLNIVNLETTCEGIKLP